MALDVIEEKVNMINNRISPIKDEYIEKFFKEKKLNLKATLDYKEAFKDAKFIIISTPTNYDDELNFFDTSSVEDIIMNECGLAVIDYIALVDSYEDGNWYAYYICSDGDCYAITLKNNHVDVCYQLN
jgi:UDP-glucose 6-dehydrogenase